MHHPFICEMCNLQMKEVRYAMTGTELEHFVRLLYMEEASPDLTEEALDAVFDFCQERLFGGLAAHILAQPKNIRLKLLVHL